MQVLSGAFNPLPTFPIHRIYLEEIFDCGSHVGTQSPFEFSLESFDQSKEPTATPFTHSPVPPTSVPVETTDAPTFTPVKRVSVRRTHTPEASSTLAPVEPCVGKAPADAKTQTFKTCFAAYARERAKAGARLVRMSLSENGLKRERGLSGNGA